MEDCMWKRISKTISRVISLFFRIENPDAYHLLELRQPQNLENLEELKKLRIKIF